MHIQVLHQQKSSHSNILGQIQGDVLNLQMNFDLSFLAIIEHGNQNFYDLHFYQQNKRIRFEKFVSQIDFAFMKTSNSYVLISNNQIEIWVLKQDNQWGLKQILGQHNFPKYYHFGKSIFISEQDDLIIIIQEEGLRVWNLDNENSNWEFRKQINLIYLSQIDVNLSPTGKTLLICSSTRQGFSQKIHNQFFINHNYKWINTNMSKISNAFKVELLGENLMAIQKNVFTPLILYEMNYWKKKIIQKRDLGLTSFDNLIFCYKKQLLYVYHQKKLKIYSKCNKNYYQKIQKLNFEKKIKYIFVHQDQGSLHCFFDHKTIQFILK